MTRNTTGSSAIPALATTLGVAAEPIGWPEFDEGELAGLIEQYSSPEWIEYR